MSHLEEGLLHALLDGEVPSNELPSIQAHLDTCPQCRERLEHERLLLGAAEGLVELLEVPAEGRPRPGRKPSGMVHWGRRLAWAASVLGAVGLGYAARGMQTPREKAEATENAPVNRVDSTPVISSATQSDTQPPPAPVQPAAPPARPTANALAGKAAYRQRQPKTVAEELQKVGASSDIRQDSATAPPRAPAAAQPAPAEISARARENTLRRLGDSPLRLEEVVVSGVSEGAVRPSLALPEPISFPDAIRRLDGTIRLIEGLVPLRLEAQGVTVRVVYPGELILSQQLIDGRVTFQLIAPPGFAPDSLAKLRAKVRE